MKLLAVTGIGVVAFILAVMTPFHGTTSPRALLPRADAFTEEAGGPPPICSDAQIARFDPSSMMSDLSAAVNPVGVVGTSVSVAFVDLPPDTCVAYHTHMGASVLYVRDGEVEYVAGTYAPNFGAPQEGVEVRRGPVSNATGTPSPGDLVPFGTPIALGADQWVTENGEVWHSYRNTGTSGDAVVVIANYAVDPTLEPSTGVGPTPGPGGCRGGCVGRGP